MSDASTPGADALPIDALYEQLSTRAARTGDVVMGTVTAVDESELVLTAGELTGTAPRGEGAVPLSEGDEVAVYIDTVEGDTITFSVHKAERLALWAQIEQARDEGETLDAIVLADGRAGLVVDLLGVKALLAHRDIGAKRGRSRTGLIGSTVPVRVTRIREKKAQISVSERATRGIHHRAISEASLSSLEVGQVLDGEVQRVTHFGAFVDIGGIDGLLHVKDMSWQRVRHPEDMVDVGDHLRVKVLRIDDENDKIALGLKQLAADPWTVAQESYLPGTKVRGEVVGLTDFGAFVMLEDGLEGLVHVSEISWTHRASKPADLLERGQRVAAWVLRCDAERKRLGLTLKNPAENPWQTIKDAFSVGTRLRTKVVRVVEFGIFVQLARGFDGLVHISDFSWGTLNQPPSAFFAPGQEVDVMVLEVDVERGRANLGIKQLLEDLSPDLTDTFTVDQVLTGQVTSLQSYGAFVAIGSGIEGLVHISAMGRGVSNPEDVLSVGEEVRVKVVSVDASAGRIGLALLRDESAAPAVDEPAAPAVDEPAAPAVDEPAAPAVDESGAEAQATADDADDESGS